MMIGLFGGTFDPVHYGHLKPALAVAQALGLSQLRFIPNRHPPHRPEPWLSTEQRLQLLELALLPYSECVLDKRELEREGPSYMVDTVKSLKQEYPNDTLCLILGQDALTGFEQWFQWQEILQYCHLVITPRPGFSVSEMDASSTLMAKITHEINDLQVQDSGKILLQSALQLDISSTHIRRCFQQDKLAQRQTVAQWMPGAVFEQLKRFFEND